MLVLYRIQQAKSNARLNILGVTYLGMHAYVRSNTTAQVI